MPYYPPSGGAVSAHASTHQDGGADEISVTALSGVLADAQVANKIATSGTAVTISSTAPSANQVLTASSATAAAWATPSSGGTVSPQVNGFRLSPQSTSPVWLATVSTPGTIYMVPYTGNTISLYNGSSWDSLSSSGTSYTLSGRTTDLPFDIFAYNNAGAVALEVLNWTNSSTRATALVQQDSVWCKSGATTRRYLGTCVATSATQYRWDLNVDSVVTNGGYCGLWNADNRVLTPWLVNDNTASWSYTTATWRAARGSNANRFSFIVGLTGQCVAFGQLQSASQNNNASVLRIVAFGLDSTTSPNSAYGTFEGCRGLSGEHALASATINLIGAAVGTHYFQWLENSAATGTSTWLGQGFSAEVLQSGMWGTFWC